MKKHRIAEALVCMPATAQQTIPGSSFDRYCSRCRRRVMISPHGQERLKAKPTMVILCVDCIPPDAEFHLCASPKETAQALRTSIPNLWRVRN